MDEFNTGVYSELQKKAVQKEIQKANNQVPTPLSRDISTKKLPTSLQTTKNVNPIDKYLFHKYKITAFSK